MNEVTRDDVLSARDYFNEISRSIFADPDIAAVEIERCSEMGISYDGHIKTVYETSEMLRKVDLTEGRPLNIAKSILTGEAHMSIEMMARELDSKEGNIFLAREWPGAALDVLHALQAYQENSQYKLF